MYDCYDKKKLLTISMPGNKYTDVKKLIIFSFYSGTKNRLNELLKIIFQRI